MEYQEFLETKKRRLVFSGFEIDEKELNKNLFDFQRFAVKKALLKGKYAFFFDCGLGKTIMQLEWANQVSKFTGKPVLILAPLAVSQQTINEAIKFDLHCEKLKSDCAGFGVYITNYEQLDNIDADQFSGVVLDECFAPDTPIKVLDTNNNLHEKHIKDCVIGEKVLNCTGFDTIKKIKSKKVDYAVKISFNGKSIISSGRHPYFTQRGWVAAKELQPNDYIIGTDKAMRILRQPSENKMENRFKEEVLRDILFSEMANESAGNNSQSSHQRESCENRGQSESFFENRKGTNYSRKDQKVKPNEESGNEKQSIINNEENGIQTFSAWGKWSRDDIASAINEGCVVRELDSGICHIFGKATKGLSNELQSRLSSLREKNSDRSGWELAPLEKSVRQKEGRETGFFGVEGFEILEQTDTRLDRYRDETGSLYFYDLEIERHPSFTINECLVHNSSILKNFEGAIKNKILDSFRYTPYKLACTATPSPNDPMELGNHAEFLDQMKRNEMLAMYFVHDGGETAKWRIKGHAIKEFYQFIASWALMAARPSDIGFSADGYSLPSLNFVEKQIKTDKRENGLLFNDTAISATDFNKELRITKIERLSEVVKIINESTENFIIWIKQNEEGEYLRKLIPEAVEVKGSDSIEYKEKILIGFANNEYRVLITKTKIAQFGLNFQNCRNQIFASLDFSFEGLYQAIRRSYRFGQKQEVNIFIITTDTMQNVIQSINTKQKQFEIMQKELSDAVNDVMTDNLLESKVYNTDIDKSDYHEIQRGDCVQLIKGIEDESIGLSVFSPPFSELYTYSSHIEDMGNTKNYQEFMIQFAFLIKELHRVMESGRNVCVHCMDLPIQKGKEGFIGLRDFSGMILRAFEDAGFIYHSRITIWKDPVVEMQRTKALGLLHKQIKKDSTMSRVGIPDYVLVFRKDGSRDSPVSNTEMSVDLWQKIASPVWMDIDQGNTLQGFRNGREERDEKHICPLQIDVVERLILLYSNKGDTVLTPFMGIGTEVYQAVKMDRIGKGFELKESYFNLAKQNIKQALSLKKTIFNHA